MFQPTSSSCSTLVTDVVIRDVTFIFFLIRVFSWFYIKLKSSDTTNTLLLQFSNIICDVTSSLQLNIALAYTKNGNAWNTIDFPLPVG